ncbi:MAG: transglycosylase domain-containing protein [Gemmatimonadota bacterium]
MKRLLLPLATGALLGLLALVTLAAVAIAASGVLAPRAGAWTARVTLAPHAGLDVSVPGLLRLATTPLGLRVLDGQVRNTALGRLQFRRAEQTLVVRCAPCVVDDRRLHTQPVTIDAIDLRLTARDSSLIEGWLASGGVQLPFSARLRDDGIDIDWSLAPTDISAIYRMFADAIPEAAMATIEGRVEASGLLRLPAATASTRLALDGFTVDGLGTERLQYGAFTFRCSGTAVPLRSGDGQPHWLAADRVGALLPAAVRAAEDQRFGRHAGFDADEIAHALEGSSFAGPARGASTITQQLARTLFTGADRTAVRKLRELLYAVEMERTLGKARVFELYLNTVDWGPGICGAQAAARTYFNKAPSKLTALEAAWLASILRNPHSAYRQQFVARRPDVERATAVLMQMRTMPRRTRERAALQALAFAPPAAARPAPRLASR